jgi:hypothetical protein
VVGKREKEERMGEEGDGDRERARCIHTEYHDDNG